MPAARQRHAGSAAAWVAGYAPGGHPGSAAGVIHDGGVGRGHSTGSFTTHFTGLDIESLRGLFGARAALVIQFLRQPPLLDQELELLNDLRNDGGDAVGIVRLGAGKLEGLIVSAS